MRKHGKVWEERRGLMKSYIESVVAGFQAKAKAKGLVKRNKSKEAV